MHAKKNMNELPTPKQVQSPEKPKNILEKQLKMPIPPMVKPAPEKTEEHQSKPPNKPAPIPALHIPKTETPEVRKLSFLY